MKYLLTLLQPIRSLFSKKKTLQEEMAIIFQTIRAETEQSVEEEKAQRRHIKAMTAPVMKKIIKDYNLNRFSIEQEYKQEFRMPSTVYSYENMLKNEKALFPQEHWYAFISFECLDEFVRFLQETGPEKIYEIQSHHWDEGSTGRIFIKMDELVFITYKSPYENYYVSHVSKGISIWDYIPQRYSCLTKEPVNTYTISN